MGTPRTHLRIALIQLRKHRASQVQEQSCFIERCQVARRQFDFFNVANDPSIRWKDVENAHAILIGGAGSFSVTQDEPFTEPMVDLVREIIERGRPLLGVCFGHQLMIKASGGTVEVDPEQEEIGSYSVSLTEAGRTDPLFAGFPSPFWAQLGHKDSGGTLGPGWLELAFSERCRIQAVRLEDAPVYGLQFHADLNEERLRERLLVYFDDYIADEEEYERIIRGLHPSIDADWLLTRFLELYA